LAPESGFITADAIKREVGHIRQSQKGAGELGSGISFSPAIAAAKQLIDKLTGTLK
jgi:hypothetical protein